MEEKIFRVATSGFQEILEQDRIRLDEESAPVPFILEEDRVALVEAVSGAGLHEKSGTLLVEEFVDDVGLPDLTVFALTWMRDKKNIMGSGKSSVTRCPFPPPPKVGQKVAIANLTLKVMLF